LWPFSYICRPKSGFFVFSGQLLVDFTASLPATRQAGVTHSYRSTGYGKNGKQYGFQH
jgi:hypothetical protein